MKKIVAFVLLLVVGLGVWAFWSFTGKEDPASKFRTEKVTRGDIQAAVTATGTVNAVTTVLVGTQVSGRIKAIYADYNAQVKDGQLIAQVDPALFEAQVDQARANLNAAQANLEKAEQVFLDAQRTLERNRQLLTRDLIAQSETDTAQTNCDTAGSQVRVAQAQKEQAAAALRTAETNLRYTRILSPVDGVVVSRNVDVGQTVAASFQTPTLFTIAQDLTKMQIDTNVDEADIGKIRLEQDVEFTVDAYADILFKGKVSQIRNAPISVQNVVTYDVVVKVDNPELSLKPGMTANVSIIVAIRNDVVQAPNAALRFRPSDREKGRPLAKGFGVWVLDNGKPKRISLTIGISDGAMTEVASGDVHEGLEVIVESLVVKPKSASTTSGPRMF